MPVVESTSMDTMPAGARAAYHAGAHYAGPFVAALLAEALGTWGRIGIRPDDALAADHFALVADLLDARADLHLSTFLIFPRVGS